MLRVINACVALQNDNYDTDYKKKSNTLFISSFHVNGINNAKRFKSVRKNARLSNKVFNMLAF